MWLEELVWLWLPVICGVTGWMSWRLVSLTIAVRELQTRVEQLEQSHEKRQWPKSA